MNDNALTQGSLFDASQDDDQWLYDLLEQEGISPKRKPIRLPAPEQIVARKFVPLTPPPAPMIRASMAKQSTWERIVVGRRVCYTEQRWFYHDSGWQNPLVPRWIEAGTEALIVENGDGITGIVHEGVFCTFHSGAGAPLPTFLRYI